MTKKHNFRVDVAEALGVNQAILLDNLAFWIKKNQASGNNFHEGNYWTFNSAKAFEKVFPYWNATKIGRMLRELEKKGVIKSKKINKRKYDRTKWYTIIDKPIMQKYTIEDVEINDETFDSDEPIPNNKTHVNKQIQRVMPAATPSSLNKKICFKKDEDISSSKPRQLFDKFSRLYKETFKESFKMKFNAKINTYMKRPIDLNNGDVGYCIEVVEFMFENWNKLRRKFNWKERVPNIDLIGSEINWSKLEQAKKHGLDISVNDRVSHGKVEGEGTTDW